MIIGYSHLTLSSADLDRDAAWLEALGFTRRFIERGLANDPAKAPYLERPAETMSLAYWEAPGSLAVELVAYERWAASSRGNYEPLFEVPAGYDVDAYEPGAWGVSPDVVSGPAGSMDVRVSFTRGAGETGRILGIRSVTADVGRERAFWCEALGCRADDADAGPPRWETASFASPLPQWRAGLLFVEGDPGPPPRMDAPGSTCLSVVVRDLEGTARTAADAGAASVSEPFEIAVNGRTLRMGIVRSPGGAIVELMEYQPEWSR